MKHILATLTVCICMATLACTGNTYPKAENALDAGREFIDACLKGDFKKANAYMLHDSTNEAQLQILEKDYNKKNSSDKFQYGQASIIIGDEETLNDSTHLIHYKNSFDKIGRKVKVLQQNNNWLVDLKYTFNGNL